MFGLGKLFGKKEENVEVQPTITPLATPEVVAPQKTSSGTLNLSKNSTLSLTKTEDDKEIRDIKIGCGWTPAKPGSPNIDIDLSAAAFTKEGRKHSITYFGDKTGIKGVTSSGDNLTGEGAGDDETLNIQLSRIDNKVTRVVFFINIYSASSRGQNMSQMKDSFANVYINGGKKYASFKLDSFSTSATGLIIGELYRETEGSPDWSFRAIGKDKPISSVSLANEGYETLVR